MPDEFSLHRRWKQDAALLALVRQTFVYGPGEDRATLYVLDDDGWIELLADVGPALLDELETFLGARFEMVAVQAYRNGSGCDWHVDTPFGAQAILSLGASRTLGVGDEFVIVDDGDLVFMPEPVRHSIPPEPVNDERCSLVFRTVTR